jgi:hypothetical protein
MPAPFPSLDEILAEISWKWNHVKKEKKKGGEMWKKLLKSEGKKGNEHSKGEICGGGKKD